MKLPFIKEREARWQRLNALLTKVETFKLPSLSKAELIELSVLHRQVAADLAIAKTQKLPETLIGFLNDLAGRSYNVIYRGNSAKLSQIKSFITTDFPVLFRQNYLVILFSFGLLFGGWLLGFLGYLLGPDVVTGLLPKGIASEIIKRYETESWFNNPLIARPYISAFIMYNNINVAITAFAGGMLLGSLTFFILVSNGFLLGVLSGAFWEKGYFLSFWAMILPHGVIELTAIALAAAGGFLLAIAILFPGEYSRSNSLKINGLIATRMAAGTILMLVLAAIIEGFLSTINTNQLPEWGRLLIAALTGTGLLAYFAGAGRIQKN